MKYIDYLERIKELLAEVECNDSQDAEKKAMEGLQLINEAQSILEKKEGKVSILRRENGKLIQQEFR